MKNILIISGIFLLFAANPVCGLWDTCPVAYNQAQNTLAGNIEKPKTIKLKITGMTCAGCSDHISNALKALGGVLDQYVEYPGDLATITYDPAKTNPDAIIKVIEKTGYKAEIIKVTTKKKTS